MLVWCAKSCTLLKKLNSGFSILSSQHTFCIFAVFPTSDIFQRTYSFPKSPKIDSEWFTEARAVQMTNTAGLFKISKINCYPNSSSNWYQLSSIDPLRAIHNVHTPFGVDVIRSASFTFEIFVLTENSQELQSVVVGNRTENIIAPSHFFSEDDAGYLTIPAVFLG